jgi:uncharacterized protein
MGILDRILPLSTSARVRAGVEYLQSGKPSEGFRLLALAARSGSPEAQYHVGCCYLDGVGVPPSRSEAHHWLEQAAQAGHTKAQHRLGVLHLHGSSGDGPEVGSGLFSNETALKPDYPAALHWSRRAAEANSPEAQALLGFLLTSGPEELREVVPAFSRGGMSARLAGLRSRAAALSQG